MARPRRPLRRRRARPSSDDADAFIVADVSAFEPMIREGVAEMKKNMQMHGPDGRASGRADRGERRRRRWSSLADAFVRRRERSASSGSTSAGPASRSTSARSSRTGSDERGRTSRAAATRATCSGAIPAEKFLFAMSMDTSSPGLRNLMLATNGVGQGDEPRGRPGRPGHGPDLVLRQVAAASRW